VAFNYEDYRQRLVDQEAHELMNNKSADKKENYSPFLIENFTEFLSEMDEACREDLRDWVEDYKTNPVGEINKLEALGRCFYLNLVDYWETLARNRAERTIPSASQLEFDRAAA
jgi:hypothetical protein